MVAEKQNKKSQDKVSHICPIIPDKMNLQRQNLTSTIENEANLWEMGKNGKDEEMKKEHRMKSINFRQP